jgi:hypothetical protein
MKQRVELGMQRNLHLPYYDNKEHKGRGFKLDSNARLSENEHPEEESIPETFIYGNSFPSVWIERSHAETWL